MSASLGYGEAASGVFQSRTHADLASAFRRAKRHSRAVRLMRVGIPLALLGAVALNVLGGWVASSGVSMPALGPLGISGTKITMDRPRMAGYTRDGRAYEVNAQSAAQDLKTPQVIELTAVRTKLQMRDSGDVTITADSGVYDTKGDMVTLKQNVLCVSPDGTEMRLTEVMMDVGKGYVRSDKPVEVLQPKMRINANGLEVVDNGAVVKFSGGVRFVSFGQGGAAESGAAADANEAQ